MYKRQSADGFLFGMDQPIIPKLLNKRFHRVADAAGLPQIRIHDLRHSHATLDVYKRQAWIMRIPSWIMLTAVSIRLRK